MCPQDCLRTRGQVLVSLHTRFCMCTHACTRMHTHRHTHTHKTHTQTHTQTQAQTHPHMHTHTHTHTSRNVHICSAFLPGYLEHTSQQARLHAQAACHAVPLQSPCSVTMSACLALWQRLKHVLEAQIEQSWLFRASAVQPPRNVRHRRHPECHPRL